MAKPTVTDLDSQIGLRLKKLRQREGLSAAALAEAVGSTQQQISRYENAQNKISAAQLYLLSRQLGVPLSWFFLDADTATKEPSPPAYIKTSPVNNNLTDDADILQALWPRLSDVQRTAILKLVDSFIL